MAIEGGCHCGAIRYKIKGDPIVHALCHCNAVAFGLSACDHVIAA